MINTLDSIKKQILDVLINSKIEEEISHAQNTLSWVLKLTTDASEELKIAALSHDMDRAVTPRSEQLPNESYDEYKLRHAKRSAELIYKFLKQYGYSEKFAKNVHELVSNHESGGNRESDLLMDADSISYFDNSLKYYLRRNGRELTQQKIKFMYARATDRARTIIDSLPLDLELKTLFNETLRPAITIQTRGR